MILLYHERIMPTINVTERTVTPRLDQGLISGLIAGAVVAVWLTLVGFLSEAGGASTPVYVSSLALGTDVFSNVGFNGNWLVGTLIHFIVFSLIGIVFALVWPRLRQYGTFTPAILFGLAAYVVVFQVVGRIARPEMAAQLNDFALIIGFIIAGFVFAFRYRRA